ncbi:hypothetical protein GCM10009786_10620 [Leucobacter alluvii]|uniref:Uncharacterized protein n=1 Tax=Leucobacter alluvii TaxID=340321 RepID=A0ABP5N0N3_9MICO
MTRTIRVIIDSPLAEFATASASLRCCGARGSTRSAGAFHVAQTSAAASDRERRSAAGRGAGLGITTTASIPKIATPAKK